MEPFQNSANMRPDKTIAQLNEDCELLIKKEIEKCLVNYVNNNKTKTANSENQRGSLEISEICSELKTNSLETRQLYFSPLNQSRPTQMVPLKERSPKMLPSPSAAMNPPKQFGKINTRRSYLDAGPKRYVDEPIQATVENYATVPRSTVLARVRQHLAKRNSAAQSAEIKCKTVKTQTETCAKVNVGVSVEPLDFVGMYEKSTNFPANGPPGVTKDQATQMYEHITQSDLFCIEWIHKNLFQVKLSPNTLVVDDKIRDMSESACIT